MFIALDTTESARDAHSRGRQQGRRSQIISIIDLRFLIYFRLAVEIRGLDLLADEYILGGLKNSSKYLY